MDSQVWMFEGFSECCLKLWYTSILQEVPATPPTSTSSGELISFFLLVEMVQGEGGEVHTRNIIIHH